MSDISKQETINIKICNRNVTVPKGMSIINAAKFVQIKIPSLCYHPDLKASASCGLCIVKVIGMNKIVRACATEVSDGMEIITHDKELYEIRKTVIELILSNHPDDCLQCQRNNNCELQRLAAEFGVREARFDKKLRNLQKDYSTPSLILDPQKCIGCGRCVEVCQNHQNVWAIEFIGRGFDMRIAPAGDVRLDNSPCIKCGQCSAHCPVGAIVERDEVEKVYEALIDEDKYPVVQIAPAVRVAFGEGFNLESGNIVTNKLYALLRRLGFKAVFDTNFAADLTIMEEATEFVNLFTKSPESLPLVTSCCPAWVSYLEKYYPDMINHFSTAKSPHEMMGVLSKTYFPEKKEIDPSKIFMVSIMPCTAKKYEITRSDEMFASGYQDIDVVLTTRELVRMTKASGIDFNNIEEVDADLILGEYSGAGTIFGATGGVMEAALRTAYFLITGEDLDKVEFYDVRGLEGVKEAEIDIKGNKVKVAIAHGIGNVQKVLDKVKLAKENGEDIPWHFIEVMACRGGCIGGGGQPYGVTDEIRIKRTAGIYTDDTKQKTRCSHQNEHIKKLYDEYLDKPNSKKAHKLLHTNYKPRPLYIK
ncbi:MAG: [FeFe] hydrogenase, group A [Spirochaetes bacterium]|nr:[FeFe] hydrogenase, group A [Spirochaetota bacterium]